MIANIPARRLEFPIAGNSVGVSAVMGDFAEIKIQRLIRKINCIAAQIQSLLNHLISDSNGKLKSGDTRRPNL